MSRPILVTGAAGFAGSHLLDLLNQRDSSRDIYCWHRPGHVPPAREPRVRWEAVDVLDRRAVVDAISRLKPATVYHCAGAAHVGQAWERMEATFATNVRGTHHLFDALGLAGAEASVLIPSSALVYQPATEALTEDRSRIPTSPYGLSKLAQELVGSHSMPGVQAAIARAFNHFGPGQDPAFSTSGFARQIAAIEAGLQPPELIVGNLDARRDLTDVRDTVRAYAMIAERGRPGRAYNVCSGRALAIRDVLEMMIARARVAIRVHVDPARFRPNDVPVLLGDPARIRDELGWAPVVPIEQTIDDVLTYWRGVIAAA